MRAAEKPHTEPVDGCVGPQRTQSDIATWVGVNGATALPSGNTTLPKDQIKSVQLVDTDTRTVLLQTNL